MTVSLRTQRIRMYVLEDIGTDGFPRARYRRIADAWAFFEPKSGTDATRFETVESTVVGTLTFDPFTAIPNPGMIRLLPGDDGLSDYRIIAVVPRRLTNDQYVYVSSFSQDERPHEVFDATPTLYPGGALYPGTTRYPAA